MLSALAVSRKNRNVPADDVFHVDLGTGALLIANDYGGAGNVFHASIFHPEFVGVFRIDGNRSRDILELRTDQGQACFVLPDRRFALPFKGSVDHRKLPSRRGLAGPDAVLATIKMHVLSDVAAIVNSGQSRADVKVHVGQKAMLGIVRAYAHSARIPVLNFNVEVADCGIERTGARIRRRFICTWAGTREEHHISGPLLKTRRACGENKCGPRSSKSDQPDSGPDIDRPGQTVAAGGNEQNALVGFLLNLIDGLL